MPQITMNAPSLIRRLQARALHGLAVALLACSVYGGAGLPTGLPQAQAKEAELLAANPEIEARMLAITAELRCLVCQNQTVADSHSGLAGDLRQQVRELLAKGKSDDEVRDYMTQRYGDFILYKPPVRASTWLLWFGPGILAVIGLMVLVHILRSRARMSPEAFDPDQPDDADAQDALNRR